MSVTGLTRIEALNKENFDTWKLQMQALLVKNDAWVYVSGQLAKPSVASEAALWKINDDKAKSDIILSISPSELKQIKVCETSRDVWLKLEGIYQSKGPARKATLLKQLTLQRMDNGGDVREHLRKFFDAVDKLNEMEVTINPDLLSVMLLYSLPASFENFRCAIESRDELPAPETLRIKITEENDARTSNMARTPTQSALYAGRGGKRTRKPKKPTSKKSDDTAHGEFRYRCHRCGTVGHKAAECTKKQDAGNHNTKKGDSVKKDEETSLRASVVTHGEDRAFRTSNLSDDGRWCLDSGATSHLTNSTCEFITLENVENVELSLADSSSTHVIANGEVKFCADVRGEIKNFRLNNTLLVPDLRTKLMSVGKITDRGFSVTFDKDQAKVREKDGTVRLIANRIDGLYYVSEESSQGREDFREMAWSSKKIESLETWHRRLGHLNERYLIEAVKNQSICGIEVKYQKERLNCDICARGKITRAPFVKESERDTELLEIVHSDVCGPMRVESNGRARYFVTFIDDRSKWCEVRFLKTKSDVLNAFKEYKASVENLKDKKIKHLQSDNGTEYKNLEFDAFVTECGIMRRFSIPYHPEQNGTAERKNRTLLDTARCLMLQSQLPVSFWAEAVSTANYIRNRTPSSSLKGKTPYEVWTGRKPDVSHCREIGCEAICLDTDPTKGKFDSRGKSAIFLGYSESSKGYRLWLSEERKVVVSRDVYFPNHASNTPAICEDFIPEDLLRENETGPSSSKSREVEIELTPLRTEEEPSDVDEPPDHELRQSRRGRGRPRIVRTGQRGRPRREYPVHLDLIVDEAEIDGPGANLAEIPLRQAVSGEDAEEWHQAIVTETRSILKHDTWKLVNRPRTSKPSEAVLYLGTNTIPTER